MTSRICPYALDPQSYLARPPEKLALGGYRGWAWTVASRSPKPWQNACRLYRLDLQDHAEAALQALSEFVETLGLCATCPLRMRQAGSGGVCRDEALMLALLSAFQHGDQEAIIASIDSICCASKADRVAHAAGVYALTLRMLDRVLLPIPVTVITHICGNAAGAAPGAMSGVTLH